MRDLILALVIFGSVPVILVRPWVGVMMWTWISLMNPHRLAWGFMYDINAAMILGAATLVAWAVAFKEDRRIPVNSITVLMFLLFAWCGVTTMFAVWDEAWIKFEQFAKIILMTFVAISLVKKPEHFRYLVWITVLSIGFFSIKGGVFTILTGGEYRVWGPPDTFVADNNALALATLMVVPLMLYLGQTSENKWVRYAAYAGALLSTASVIGSHSRGGFLGLASMLAVLGLRIKHKVMAGLGLVVVVSIAMSYVPQKWFDRMGTIENYEQDGSAMSRLESWGHAIRIANDRPILGGGFLVFDHDPTYQRLSPEIANAQNVHSIYFEMLGTQGYVGLALFLMLGAAGLLTCRRIKRLVRDRPDLQSARIFGNMMQCSLVAYAVSGTFLNLSTYDLYYTLLALTSMQYLIVRNELKKPAPQPSEDADTVVAPEQGEKRTPLRLSQFPHH
jgi:probable O-glycosylation ligase (exosortase A-associated)